MLSMGHLMGNYNFNYPQFTEHLPRSAWKKLPKDLITFLMSIGFKKPSDIADQHSVQLSSGLKQDMSCLDDELFDCILEKRAICKKFYDDVVKNQLYGILNTGYIDTIKYKRSDGNYNTKVFYSFKDQKIWDGDVGAKWIKTPYKQWIQMVGSNASAENKRLSTLKKKLNPNVFKLDASKLPTDLRDFSIAFLGSKKYGGLTTVVPKRTQQVKNPTIMHLNNDHKDACKEVETATDIDGYMESDETIKLIDEKLLFLVYDPKEYRLRETRWYSFRDKKIYTWNSYEDGNKGFYNPDGKTLTFRPIPYKQWLMRVKK
ncbi:MAG: hypothetical protein R3250_03035 [Melioribacteraceae bacterium]|nr:hypothetical protein [Melioribacteraceae bacterium]